MPAGRQVFQVAVIGSNQDDITCCQTCLHHPAEVFIHAFSAFNFGLTVGSVTDHVAVGKIGHDQVVVPFDAQ